MRPAVIRIGALPTSIIDAAAWSRDNTLDPEWVMVLAASIKEHGMFHPIGVIHVKGSVQTYRLVWGGHRLGGINWLGEHGTEGGDRIVACGLRADLTAGEVCAGVRG